MSKQRDRIARKMRDLGAGYANDNDKHVSPNDPGASFGEARPSYHVLPDIENPWQSSILRFESLTELESWLGTRAAALQLPDDQAEELMARWYEVHS